MTDRPSLDAEDGWEPLHGFNENRTAESTGLFLGLAADQLELLAGRAEAAGLDPEAFA